MFTNEHEFDMTIVTVMDEEGDKEDMIIDFHDEGVDIKQFNETLKRYDLITITHKMMFDMLTAMKYPEGAYVTYIEEEE